MRPYTSRLLALSVLALSACAEEPNDRASTEPTADPVDLTRVALHQGVEVTLMEDGQAPSDSQVPVVAGRPALVRVFVGALDAERDLTATVHLSTGGDPSGSAVLDAASRPGQLDSTLNVEIPDGIAPDTAWSVEVTDADGTVVARYPESGDQPLDAVVTGSMDIVLIPVRYQFDGSDRMPDTSPDEVLRVEELVGAVFPADTVTVTVGPTLDWSDELDPMGPGFASLLNQVSTLRERAQVPRATWYMGLVEPSDDFETWCSNGCVQGEANAGGQGSTSTYYQASVIVPSGDMGDTLVTSSLGFNLGLRGAPGCGRAGVDPDYPYGEDDLGRWGYDRRTGELVAPDAHSDIMSNCGDTWISDYHYASALEKLQAVHAL